MRNDPEAPSISPQPADVHAPLSLGWAESLVARRLMRHLEPELEHLIHQTLRSDTAQTLLADTMADVLSDLIEPSGAEAGGLAEHLLLSMVGKYLDRPHFRIQIETMLARRSVAAGPTDVGGRGAGKKRGR